MELVYWPLRGLGQPVVSLLEYLRLNYIHTRVSDWAAWQQHKAQLVAQNFLLANLPYLRDSDFLLAESHAVMRYLCRKTGRLDLLPTAEEEAKFNELAGAVVDFKTLSTDPFYLARSSAELLQSLRGIFEIRLASRLKAFVVFLTREPFLFGRLTYLDFVLAENLEMLLTAQDELGAEFLPAKETLQTYVQRVNALEGLREYRLSDRFQARPFNGAMFGAVWY